VNIILLEIRAMKMSEILLYSKPRKMKVLVADNRMNRSEKSIDSTIGAHADSLALVQWML